jgi:hypothetical protein
MSKDFWNNKYFRGGISGKGSIGKYREWKWKTIDKVIGNFHEVIDLGCGDMKFWDHKIGKKLMRQKDFLYIGVDISDYIIEKNSKRDRDRIFINQSSEISLGIRSQVVFVLDLLFHIMDKERLIQTLKNVCYYAREWIVIYNWVFNPFALEDKVTDGISQHYWNLTKPELVQIFWDNNFKIEFFTYSPYDPYGALTIYRKKRK